MARKKSSGGGKKSGGDDNRRRRPNYKLPADDHLDIKPLRRTETQTNEARVGRLLSHEWDLFTSKERKAAALAAYSFGAELAVEAHADGESAYGDLDDYRRVCVKFAWDAKVCNDVEVELWRSASENDPRLIAFEMGFQAEMERLQAAG